MIWKKFNALGTEVIISAALREDQACLLDMAQSIIVNFEKKFSRFLIGNELADFNNFSGGEFLASKEFIEIVGVAQKMHERTAGIFDPTIIGNLEEVGYDKSFVLADKNITDKKVDREKLKQDFAGRVRFSNLKITDDKIIKPSGLRVDFGGLGKGYIVDRLSKTIFAEIENYWISAGGDIVARGHDEGIVGWKIGVQNPHQPTEEIFQIKTKGEKIGIATSGIFQRRGKSGDFEWHHVIDARTGLPTENNILAVTAIAPSAMESDVFAKTVLILGSEEGLKFIEAQSEAASIIFLKDGEVIFSKRVLKYL